MPGLWDAAAAREPAPAEEPVLEPLAIPEGDASTG
jgi:hypothetical protein